MFDFLRNRGSTAGEEGQEMLSAYLDNALTPAERQRLENALNRDPALRAQLEHMRLLKLQMRAMPRRRVPRSFALDPALYGRPKAQPMMQLYPVLRGATALAAFLLIFVFALGAFQGQFSGEAAPAAEVSILSSTAAEEAAQAPAQEAATVPAETDRVAPTAAPEEEAAAEMAAQEAITEGLSLETQAPVGEGAPDAYPGVVEAPPTDLAFGTPAPEATVAAIEPTLEAATELAGTSVAAFEPPADETANVAAQEQTPVTDSGSGFSGLQWLQLGLGVVFLLLFILWLIARRRVRSL